MKVLLILYLMYLSWGTAGQGEVSILEMARYLRKSKSQVKADILKLADMGYLELRLLHSAAGAKKYFIAMTDEGDRFLMENFEEAQAVYHQYVAETILAINARNAGITYSIRKLSKRERDALKAGQKDMFSEG